MKGFLLSLLALGAAFYFIRQGDPAVASGGDFAAATGEAIEINPGNYEARVKFSEAPVLAYYWAPW